ncbi:MAG: GntR family transcriptional regulator [Rhodococcus sp. (in: high G+C Gram-positive bacteria)]|jgi:GntR family transcriptional regulator
MNGAQREPAGPAYQVVSSELRADIVAGKYSGGVRLPTEADLSDRYSVSRQTVRRAFLDLVAEGIVYRVAGRGTFVNESGGRYLRQLGSIEDLMNLSSDTTVDVVSGLARRTDIDSASRLRQTTDAVHTVVFRRLHEGIPFVLTTVHLPEDIGRHLLGAPELATGAVGTHTVIALLERHLSSPIEEAAQSITAQPATDEVASLLGCAAGHPMLRVDRLYSDGEGRPVELAVSYFLPEHYTYRVTLRRQRSRLLP